MTLPPEARLIELIAQYAVVGVEVGAGVGEEVGAVVGLGVGAGVGEEVGAVVGLGVGAGVGEGVGAVGVEKFPT